jgi:hypothetical protein
MLSELLLPSQPPRLQLQQLGWLCLTEEPEVVAAVTMAWSWWRWWWVVMVVRTRRRRRKSLCKQTWLLRWEGSTTTLRPRGTSWWRRTKRCAAEKEVSVCPSVRTSFKQSTAQHAARQPVASRPAHSQKKTSQSSVSQAYRRSFGVSPSAHSAARFIRRSSR